MIELLGYAVVGEAVFDSYGWKVRAFRVTFIVEAALCECD